MRYLKFRCQYTNYTACVQFSKYTTYVEDRCSKCIKRLLNFSQCTSLFSALYHSLQQIYYRVCNLWCHCVSVTQFLVFLVFLCFSFFVPTAALLCKIIHVYDNDKTRFLVSLKAMDIFTIKRHVRNQHVARLLRKFSLSVVTHCPSAYFNLALWARICPSLSLLNIRLGCIYQVSQLIFIISALHLYSTYSYSSIFVILDTRRSFR